MQNADLGVVIEEEESIADSMDLSKVAPLPEEGVAEAMLEAAVYEQVLVTADSVMRVKAFLKMLVLRRRYQRMKRSA